MPRLLIHTCLARPSSFSNVLLIDGVCGEKGHSLKTGSIVSLGVNDDPLRSIRCSNSPKMQPTDHMSMADEYLPRAITTSGAR
jgi:hypothetical protein